jgi:erythrocyte band 7 integral membrane protein
MQIRYLDAMQQMAKSANSKVIFLPAPNQTVQHQMQMADAVGEGPSSYQGPSYQNVAQHSGNNDFGSATEGFQNAINSRVVENM